MTEQQGVSRRRVLTIAACAAGISVAGASVARAQAKTAQKAVKYQDTPKGDQRCENCKQFQPPSACKVVDGTISPQGWCMVYMKA
ncbi:high-potential iron-sulfur protein [Bradyrhizobium elkanii]|uniref:high-potential iron-sulfur protein n=1 Tax=Bradyrhizobium elkanii TaxID=29448 RepID=UPI0009B69EAE|nr:high-potential iron-sulfur protein [Bradyrhizobium elkanii]